MVPIQSGNARSRLQSCALGISNVPWQNRIRHLHHGNHQYRGIYERDMVCNRQLGWLGRSIAEAALAEGHDVVASARCAGGTDCKERCHEIDPCRTSCSGHGIDRGAAHQPLFQGHAGQHRRRDQHRLSRTFIGLAMYVPAEVTARTSADFLIPGIKTDVYTIVLD